MAILVTACNEQLEYLEVHAKNTGISTTSYGDDLIKQITTDDGSDDTSGKDSSDSKSKG